jgi:N4-gp56 family major capsid protein
MAITVNSYATTGGSLYGDLSVEDAIKIQKNFLPIAKQNLTMGRFAQKESKGKNEGNIIRHRRYKKLPLTDEPLAEGVTPDFDVLDSEVISHPVKQFGRYAPVTDLMMLLGEDPYLSIIMDRQAIQFAETVDLLCYKKFRAPSNVVYSQGATRRSEVKLGLSRTGAEFDAVIRFMENNNAVKITEMLAATPGVDTHPVRAGYFAICHPNLRQDLEAIEGFVPIENYSSSTAAVDYEIGAFKGIRFICTTVAVPFDRNGDLTDGAGDTISNMQAAAAAATDGETLVKGAAGNEYVEVYPIIIVAKDAIGTSTIGGMDSLVPKVVKPTPSGTDPLGQRGTVGYIHWWGGTVLNEDWIICVETGVRTLSASVTAGTGASWDVPPAPYMHNV